MTSSVSEVDKKRDQASAITNVFPPHALHVIAHLWKESVETFIDSGSLEILGVYCEGCKDRCH